MNNLEMKSFGVQELDAEEVVNVDGGWWQLGIAVAGALIYIYNEGGDFIDGVVQGFNETAK
jgi:lactobin A/cerein 7B family class IIb bacteriocin